MADFQVSVKYNSAAARVALFITVFLLPVWGILVPAMVLVVCYFIITQPGEFINSLMRNMDHLLEMVGMALGVLLVPMVGTACVLTFADNRISATKSGLSLPFFVVAPMLLFKRNIPWQSIRKLQLVNPATGETAKDKQSSRLVMHLDSGQHIDLKVSQLSEREVEQLLLAFTVWGANCEKSPELIEYQEKLQHNPDAQEDLSYTTMWEDELARRFSGTSFMPLEPNTILQERRLKVIRQLSFGGLSAIYLCQKNSRELVVLKEAVIPESNDSEVKSKAAELFDREARLLIRLSHPAIVKVLDHFTERSRNYLLLEYINGQDLRQYTNQHGPQSPDVVLAWAAQITAILDYLHNQAPPIIHRDLTPDNLVLDTDNTVKLIDFGAANEFIGKATGTLVGKQAYIAPEQFRGHADTRSDIYALGCTIFFLLTGQDPEALSTSRPSTVLPDISLQIDELVAALTNMNEEARVQSARQASQMIKELNQADLVA